MSPERSRVPDLQLEQYALGELPGNERAAIEGALAADEGLRARLAELRRSDEEILREAPPAEIAAAIRRRMLSALPSTSSPRPSRLAHRPLASFAFPAAAALLVLAGTVMARGFFFPSTVELSRPKGGTPGISIYMKAPSGPKELRDGDLASAGDVLQIKYGAGGTGYGAVFSLDGRGTLTGHLPAPGGPDARSPRLEAGGASLASAYELDDAPGFERFFLIYSPAEFKLSVAVDALRGLASSGGLAATGSLSLPAGLEWKSLLLRKAGAK